MYTKSDGVGKSILTKLQCVLLKLFESEFATVLSLPIKISHLARTRKAKSTLRSPTCRVIHTTVFTIKTVKRLTRKAKSTLRSPTCRVIHTTVFTIKTVKRLTGYIISRNH